MATTPFRSPIGLLIMLTVTACSHDAPEDRLPFEDATWEDSAAPVPATGGPALAVVGTTEEVALLDLVTGALTTVLSTGYVSHLRLSPGGTRVAWQHSNVWVGEADGTSIINEANLSDANLVDFLDDGRVLIGGLVQVSEGFLAMYLDPPELGYSSILYEDGDDMHISTSRLALDDENVVFFSRKNNTDGKLTVLNTRSLHDDREQMPSLDACEPVWLLGGETVACGIGDTLVVGDARLDDVQTVALPLSLTEPTLVPVSERAVLAISETVIEEDAVCFEAEEDDVGKPCIVEIDVETGAAHRVVQLEAQEAELTKMLVSAEGPTLLYAAGDTLVRAYPDGSGATVMLEGVQIIDLDW